VKGREMLWQKSSLYHQRHISMKYCTSIGSNALALRAYSLPARKDAKGEARAHQAAKGCVRPCKM